MHGKVRMVYVQHETTKIQAEFSKIMTFLSLIAVDILTQNVMELCARTFLSGILTPS